MSDGLKKLREPFTDLQVSKLPKPTYKGAWDNQPKQRCNTCGGYHPAGNTIHLDYVGHAALTDRLLDADPQWHWEPLALDDRGLPAFDRDGGLWIKLTVAGVTRLGYGDSQGKTGPNAVKEAIGDALRNAAMRFGAALALWHKGELHVEEPHPSKVALDRLLGVCTDMGLQPGEVAQRFMAEVGVDVRQADADRIDAFTETLLAEGVPA